MAGMERQRDLDLDLITIGRSGIDLYGEQVGGRLEDMASFAKYIGGSPTNTAVGASRLGLRSGLLTRVGADHFGRFIREQLQREGVSTRAVLEDAQRLTALVFLGIRDPDTFPLIFYCENCADMALEAADVDPAFLGSTGAVLINGTHLSQPNVFDASLRACEIVRAAGGKVVFDIDYRPVLWGLTGKDAGANRFVAHAAFTARLQEVLPLCDLIVGTEEEVHILGGSTDTVAALRVIREKTDALLVRWLSAQYVEVDGEQVQYFAGVWAIFGHGNVAGMGEALHARREAMPTWRAHNGQGMAHAAIAYAKQMRRQRAMVCTTSIGPGATNMVTAAALAHVNHLPVLLVPGDVYASRRPDPVLQQLEDFNDATVSVNDCFKPVRSSALKAWSSVASSRAMRPY